MANIAKQFKYNNLFDFKDCETDAQRREVMMSKRNIFAVLEGLTFDCRAYEDSMLIYYFSREGAQISFRFPDIKSPLKAINIRNLRATLLEELKFDKHTSRSYVYNNKYLYIAGGHSYYEGGLGMAALVLRLCMNFEELKEVIHKIPTKDLHRIEKYRITRAKIHDVIYAANTIIDQMEARRLRAAR